MAKDYNLHSTLFAISVVAITTLESITLLPKKTSHFGVNFQVIDVVEKP